MSFKCVYCIVIFMEMRGLAHCTMSFITTKKH